MYDYVIVGGGPSSMTLAWILAGKNKQKVLILEKEGELGGCHRVRRVNGLFTEHGPRVYGRSYLNMLQIIQDMFPGTTLDTFFAPYRFSMTTIGGRSATEMSIKELLVMGSAFARKIIQPNYGRKIKLGEFVRSYKFSDETYQHFDRICRLTDGAGIERYTLHEFLFLFDAHMFYPIMQPKRPNDLGLFKKWIEKLENIVDIKTMSKVEQLFTSKNKISGLSYTNNGVPETITGKNFILAIPPAKISSLLLKSKLPNAFGPDFHSWSHNTDYLNYLPIVFHWNHPIKLPKVYGFPKSEWGLAHIVMTDYMTFDHPDSKLVISTCTTYPDRISSRSHKTADQSTKEELIQEALAQLRESYPNLPEPTHAILSPGVERKGGKWLTRDTAYVLTVDGYQKEHKSDKYNNLYHCGPHNGHHSYEATSIEAAMTNAIVLGNRLVGKKMFRLKRGWNVTDILRIILFVVILIIFFRYRNII